jgi:hypothetical protein
LLGCDSASWLAILARACEHYDVRDDRTKAQTMRLRFHRHIKLFGGLVLNLAKRGASLSWRPLRGLSLNSKRGLTASIPGTGISVNQPLVRQRGCGHLAPAIPDDWCEICAKDPDNQ